MLEPLLHNPQIKHPPRGSASQKSSGIYVARLVEFGAFRTGFLAVKEIQPGVSASGWEYEIAQALPLRFIGDFTDRERQDLLLRGDKKPGRGRAGTHSLVMAETTES